MTKRSTKRPSARMKAKERLADQFAELQALELSLSRALTQWEAVEKAELVLRESLEPLVERGYSRTKIAALLGVDTADITRVLSFPLEDGTEEEGLGDGDEHPSGVGSSEARDVEAVG